MKKVLLVCSVFIFIGQSVLAESMQNENIVRHSYHSTLGEDFKWGGLALNASTAEIGDWIINGDTKRVMAISFQLQNNAETKKLDFSKGISYYLIDEFLNEYRLLDFPENYSKELIAQPPLFPSLYPGELFSQTVFFEAPVKTARYLLFSVFAPEIGITQEIQIKITIDEIIMKEKSIREEYKQAVKQMQKKDDLYDPHSSDTLKIVRPFSGKPVKPGELIYLKVKLKEGIVPPDELLVISPMYTLTDTDLVYGYKIVIPKEQPKGELSISVIARWHKEDKILSDSITFNVLDEEEGCLENCLTKNEK